MTRKIEAPKITQLGLTKNQRESAKHLIPDLVEKDEKHSTNQINKAVLKKALPPIVRNS